jgi:hypothetical protein
LPRNTEQPRHREECLFVEQAELDHLRRGLPTRPHPELAQNRRHVVADGLLGDEQAPAMSELGSPSAIRASTSSSRAVSPAGLLRVEALGP